MRVYLSLLFVRSSFFRLRWQILHKYTTLADMQGHQATHAEGSTSASDFSRTSRDSGQCDRGSTELHTATTSTGQQVVLLLVGLIGSGKVHNAMFLICDNATDRWRLSNSRHSPKHSNDTRPNFGGAAKTSSGIVAAWRHLRGDLSEMDYLSLSIERTLTRG